MRTRILAVRLTDKEIDGLGAAVRYWFEDLVQNYGEPRSREMIAADRAVSKIRRAHFERERRG